MLIVVLIIVAVIAAIVIIAAGKPDTFRIERSVGIKASPEKIFPLIDDLHQWEGWSPWEKVDLNMKKTFSGADSGKGAIYEWDGDKKIGAGKMEITESAPHSKVIIKLDFVRPFAASNTTEFTLRADGESTTVTWAMSGCNTFIGKVMSIFMNMDKMMGGYFEQGLNSMKGLAEK